jgi:hypothetical protein
MNITEFVKQTNLKTLVDIYNTALPEKPVKKFTDRKTAEARLLKLMAGSPDYITFYNQHATKIENFGIDLPALAKPVDPLETPEMARAKKMLEQERKNREQKGSAPAPTPAAPATKRRQPSDAPAKKQNTPPHLNVRCAACGYYAKTTPAMMKIARLLCPVDHKHGMLLTAEERGEKRGR